MPLESRMRQSVIINPDREDMKFHIISVPPSCHRVLGVASHLGMEYELNELSAF